MANDAPLDPAPIMQTATAFWSSRVLLAAVEFDLFSTLANGAMTAAELGEALGLHPRAHFDFPDALVALGFLQRDGDGPAALYRNTPETAAFLDRRSPDYLGGIAAMLGKRLFRFWYDLPEALRTGQPQNELRHNGQGMFETLYADPERLREFLEAMSGLQRGNFRALASAFDFAAHGSVCDIGGALALLSRTLATQHPHLALRSFDLAEVNALARQCVEADGLAARIELVSGDFFADEFPRADVITMGNILHDWNLDKKKQLIAKAFRALPAGGALIAIENVIDDARRDNAFGLLMSLNMLIEFGDAFDYTGAEFRTWCAEAGFSRFEQIALTGAASAAIAYKD